MSPLTNPTPAEIDAAVAEHVAGWRPANNPAGWQCAEASGQLSKWWTRDCPPYSTSADAVLPYIEGKWDAVITRFEANKTWQVDLVPSGGKYVVADGSATTFPMAACLALLRAHGVTVTMV